MSAPDITAEGTGPTGQLDLLATPPVEDDGSDAIDRFEFQIQCVARHCIDLLDTESDLSFIVCEWHTDVLLVRPGDRVAMVSVKHRESSRGPWTVARLLDDEQGGLGTLFARWKANGEPEECRFVTNAGLDRDAAKLARACAENAAELEELALGISGRLGTDVSSVLPFLRALRFDHDLPSRRHMEAVNVVDRVAPMLGKHGRDTRRAPDCYRKLLDLIRTASRAALPAESTQVSSPTSLDPTFLVSATVAARRIGVEAVIQIFAEIEPVEAAPPSAPGPAGSRLVHKLRTGGVPETAVRAAARSRLAWTAHEARTRPPVPDLDTVEEDLRTVVTHEAALAQVAAQAGCSSSDEAYGAPMLLALELRLQRAAAEAGSINSRLLMGLAYDLTAACEIWWSAKYDVDAAIAAEFAGQLT